MSQYDWFNFHFQFQPTKVYDPTTICFPQRDFAIGIAIAGLILIAIVILAILILLTRRRRRKDLSTTGSSIYSGPYTNTAYSSHSSWTDNNKKDSEQIDVRLAFSDTECFSADLVLFELGRNLDKLISYKLMSC